MYNTLNNPATSLFWTAHTGLCWEPTKLENINFTNKKAPKEAFDDIPKVFLDMISDNISSLVQKGKYGTISTIYPTKTGLIPSSFFLT